MKIKMRWLEGEAKGFVDVFETDLFVNGALHVLMSHDILTSSGRYDSTARCFMSCVGDSVTLDYSTFSENKKHNILLGILHFNLNINSKPCIFNVTWQDQPNAHALPVKVMVTHSRKRPVTEKELIERYQEDLDAAKNLSIEDLIDRLPAIGNKPPKIEVLSHKFVRSPYVVLFSLNRAAGKCEKCGLDAPFHKKSDGEPYLEVHHTNPLFMGGSDDINNTQALCPNCHREVHFGLGI